MSEKKRYENLPQNIDLGKLSGLLIVIEGPDS